MKLNPPKSGWVERGKKAHIDIERLMKRRDLARIGLSKLYNLKQEISLSSEKLHIHGICDGFIETKDPKHFFPFEIKSSPTPQPSRSAALQLCAYAMMLEEHLGSQIKTGFILCGIKTKVYPIQLNEQIREETISCINRIIEDCDLSIVPDSDANEGKCSQCEFLNFCADRL